MTEKQLRKEFDETMKGNIELWNNGWQPIETAPRDRTLVWGYWPEQPQKYDQMYRVGELWYSGQDEAGCRECPCTDPTHWMPLPPPPQ